MNDIEPDQCEYQRYFNIAGSRFFLGCACIVLVFEMFGGKLETDVDFVELEAKNGYGIYKVSEMERIFPVMKPVYLILVFGSFPLFLTQLFYPSLARVNCVGAMCYIIADLMFPSMKTSRQFSELQLHLQTLLLTIMFQTDFYASLITMLISLVTTTLVITPLMY